MRVLVTGGAGFIGSHLCERLLDSKHSLVIIDDLNDSYSPALKRHNLQQVRRQGSFSFREADICDMQQMSSIAQEHRIEAIIHLAARAGVRASICQPLDYEKTNVRGTIVMLEVARRLAIDKFLFASSSSVYGIVGSGPCRESDSSECPISPYAATKVAAERMCFTYSYLYGLSVVCLRFFTVYGPRQRPDLAIHKFTNLIAKHSAVSIYGSASTRDYTYVADIVDGIVAALAYECRYEVFNLGSSNPITVNRVIECIEHALDIPATIEAAPPQPGDVPVTYADISKAQRLLGYAPKMAFDQGIASFVDWYLAMTFLLNTSIYIE